MKPTIAEFIDAYVAETIEFRKIQNVLSAKQPLEFVHAMIKQIRESGNCDWLKYNPALKKVAKKFGFTKSSQLRDFIKATAPTN